MHAWCIRHALGASKDAANSVQSLSAPLPLRDKTDTPQPAESALSDRGTLWRAGGQSATAGMMPSSDSDSEAEAPAEKPKPAAPPPAAAPQVMPGHEHHITTALGVMRGLQTCVSRAEMRMLAAHIIVHRATSGPCSYQTASAIPRTMIGAPPPESAHCLAAR